MFILYLRLYNSHSLMSSKHQATTKFGLTYGLIVAASPLDDLCFIRSSTQIDLLPRRYCAALQHLHRSPVSDVTFSLQRHIHLRSILIGTCFSSAVWGGRLLAAMGSSELYHAECSITCFFYGTLGLHGLIGAVSPQNCTASTDSHN
jgi:hypothetical protein